MNMQVLGARRDVSGGYKVDVTRGQNIGRVSSEWFSRPNDARFLSLGELADAVLDAGTLESWDLLTGWIVDRPVWAGEPVDAGQHERGLAVSSFFCAASGGMVCGVDSAWPNLNAVMPMLDRATAAFGAEKTAFNAMLALMRARPDRLLPDPGLGWIGRVVRARRSSIEFWEYASNGEKVVLLLRELIAARALEQHHREIVVEVSDALIELGVKGAAFLQQDLVRHAR